MQFYHSMFITNILHTLTPITNFQLKNSITYAFGLLSVLKKENYCQQQGNVATFNEHISALGEQFSNEKT
jgi:hypothetical protein